MRYLKYLICGFIFFNVNNQLISQSQIGNSGGCNFETVVYVNGDYNESNNWILKFEDNFDGVGKNPINSTLWQKDYPWGRTLIGALEQQYYADNNVYIFDGNLVLRVNRESVFERAVPYEADNVIKSDGLPNKRWFDYTSGMVFSKQEFGYGKYEIRCKLPKGKGMFPAFWTFAQFEQDVEPYEEIDVFEFWNESTANIYNPSLNQKIPHFGSIYDYFLTHDDTRETCGTDWTNGTNYSDGFHTFTMIYDELKIEWYVDGILRYKKPRLRDVSSLAGVDYHNLVHGRTYFEDVSIPRGQKFNIIANVAVQKSSQNEPDGSNVFPTGMLVDYIRFYKKEPPCIGPVLNVYENSVLDIDPDKYNQKVADQILLHTNVNLFWGQQIDLTAKNEVLFFPGTTIDGGDFLASVNPTFCSSYNRSSGNGLLDDDSTKQMTQLILNKRNDFISYPNPTNSILNIEFGEDLGESFNVSLFDLQGRALYSSKSISSNTMKIDMSLFSSGSYILLIFNESGKRVYSNKIIKE